MSTAQVTASRTITAPDGDISTLPRYTCDTANLIRLGAECSLANQTLSCRLAFWDGNGNYAGMSQSVTFTSDAMAGDGTKFLATPSIDPWFPTGGNSQFAIHADTVSGGSWPMDASSV